MVESSFLPGPAATPPAPVSLRHSAMGDIHENDHRSRYCPRLGHAVPFSYCRSPGSDTPCGKMLDCWWEVFDVRSFAAAHYPAAVVEGMGAPPQPKIASLVDLIRQAQERSAPGPAAATPPADRSSPE